MFRAVCSIASHLLLASSVKSVSRYTNRLQWWDGPSYVVTVDRPAELTASCITPSTLALCVGPWLKLL